MTPLGSQETGEDSPEGYPQTPTYKWWNRHDNYDAEASPDPNWVASRRNNSEFVLREIRTASAEPVWTFIGGRCYACGPIVHTRASTAFRKT
jgi:hypothetical protein